MLLINYEKFVNNLSLRISLTLTKTEDSLKPRNNLTTTNCGIKVKDSLSPKTQLAIKIEDSLSLRN